MLSQVKTALEFFDHPNLQKQGRAAHVLLRYDPKYSTFSTADHILILKGKQYLTTLIFPNFKSLRDIGLEGSASEDQGGEVNDRITEQPSQSNSDGSKGRLGEEIDRALNLAIEEVDFNLPSTSG